jgi:hypothetical protein
MRTTSDCSMNIDNPKTVIKFNYLPSSLRLNSEKLVVWFCSGCGILKDKKYREAKKNTLCIYCSNKKNANNNLQSRSAKMKEWHKNNDHPLKGCKRPESVLIALRNSLKGRIVSDKRKKELSILYSGKGNNM